MNARARTSSVALSILLFGSTVLAAPPKNVPQHRTPRFVDIAATVKNQVEASIAGVEEKNPPSAATVAAKTPGSGEQNITMLGLAFLLSAISTFLILRHMAARAANGLVGSPARGGQPSTVSGRPLVPPSSKAREPQTPLLPVRIAGKALDDEVPLHDEQTFRLLQSFHRGHGELSLAMRLGSDTRGNRTREKLQRVLPQVEGDDGRAHVARKLGVSKGEIDLAVHLKEFGTSQLRKEQL